MYPDPALKNHTLIRTRISGRRLSFFFVFFFCESRVSTFRLFTSDSSIIIQIFARLYGEAYGILFYQSQWIIIIEYICLVGCLMLWSNVFANTYVYVYKSIYTYIYILSSLEFDVYDPFAAFYYYRTIFYVQAIFSILLDTREHVCVYYLAHKFID